jgi:hypothetical protein
LRRRLRPTVIARAGTAPARESFSDEHGSDREFRAHGTGLHIPDAPLVRGAERIPPSWPSSFLLSGSRSSRSRRQFPPGELVEALPGRGEGVQSEGTRQVPSASLRVRPNRPQDVDVPVDGEVEAPGERHARLPEPPGLVVLLRLKGRVAEVREQEAELLPERTLHVRGRRRAS